MKPVRYIFFLSFLCLTLTGNINSQWQNTWGPTGFAYQRVECFAQLGSVYFCGTYGDEVWKSTDNGSSNWIQASNGLPAGTVSSLLVSGTDLFAATISGVFKSTDSGTSWTVQNDGLSNTNVTALVLSGDNIFASTYGGIFKSTNNGSNWNAVNDSLTTTFINGLTVKGTNLFACSYGFGSSGVYISTNNGGSWNAANSGLNVNSVSMLVPSGENLFAVTLNGTATQVYISTNNGTSWNSANNGLPESIEKTLLAVGNNVFATAYDKGIFLTTDNGSNWIEVNEGFGTSRTVRSLGILGNEIFAGFYGYSVFRRPLSQMITSVEHIAELVPNKFNLEQNYPNPFNPTTTFRFSIPREEFVKLKIFDSFGQEVTTLISEEMQPGTFEINWDASSAASGVYFGRLQAGDFFQTKKLSLLK